MEARSQIKPEILQQFMDSCANPKAGMSQYFTPFPLAQRLALALPRVRPCIVDLNCGGTALLQAAANGSTEALLGADIDPCRARVEGMEKLRPVNRITHDLTRLYPLLKEVNFQADLFVLNPPWRLWWHRDKLADLAQSEVEAVRDAFAQMEESAHRQGTVDGTIDSTIATIMIALDLMAHAGEAYCVANDATLERLIFSPGAPHAALARHVWAHVVIPGNPMTGIDDCLWEKENQFHTGVIYFARSHHTGPTRYEWAPDLAGPLPDRLLRMGNSVLANYGDHEEKAVDRWNCVKERVREMNGGAAIHPYNLWLSVSGRIRTNLSRFEERSVKVDKQAAARMHNLEGQSPMELVLQRNQRDELLHVIECGGWKVEPALIQAVRQAVTDYHSARAPLYPLPEIQRLAFCDEQDTIVCKRDLLHTLSAEAAADRSLSMVLFKAGQTYSIRTQTVEVNRRIEKFNPFQCRMDTIEFSGQELAIYISDGILNPQAENQSLNEYCFMDQKIKNDKNTTVVNAGKRQRRSSYRGPEVLIDFTLQQLAEHFLIPEVPDVASANPEGYQQNLAMLTELEQITEDLN